MTAELADQLRVARRHGIQGVTNVKARHRTGRTLEHAIPRIGKGNGWPVIAFFEARGKNTDHTLVPVWLEQAQAKGHRLQRQVFELGQRFALHALFDGFAILVQFVQLPGHLSSQVRIIAKQALDPQAHVIEATGGIEPWPENKAQVSGGDTHVIAPSHFQNRLEPRTCAASTNALQTLMHEDTVVGIQRHHVGDTAQCHQVE
ncbi:hypothetical protein D3C77_461350 [compost metagenome]